MFIGRVSGRIKFYSNYPRSFHDSKLIDGILIGDRSSLARAITLVESKLPNDSRDSQKLIRELEKRRNKQNNFETKNTLRIGISGSPGVGKSSLIERLGIYCIENENLKVATLAIDPSSESSGGSILGDKTRMSKLANDMRAFIRPSPSGGQLGGVARGTFSSIKLCELAGFDIVFIESVGVGQSEYHLADLSDIFILCCSPMSGDDLQAMKRGISERADLILLNKVEEPIGEAGRKALMELKMSQSLKNHPVPVIPVSALKGSGIKETWSAIKQIQKDHLESGEFSLRRREQQGKWLKSFIKFELIDKFDNYLASSPINQFNGDSDPLTLSDQIINNFCNKTINP